VATNAKDLLEQLASVWIQVAAPSASDFVPGLSRERTSRAFDLVGLRAPVELQEWYEWRNGGGYFAPFNFYAFGVDDALDHLRWAQSLIEEADLGELWPPTFWPIGKLEGPGTLAVDTSGDTMTPVFEVWWDSGTRLRFKSLAEMTDAALLALAYGTPEFVHKRFTRLQSANELPAWVRDNLIGQ
jgi:hypothetical protein